jgi:hypothetical protein
MERKLESKLATANTEAIAATKTANGSSHGKQTGSRSKIFYLFLITCSLLLASCLNPTEETGTVSGVREKTEEERKAEEAREAEELLAEAEELYAQAASEPLRLLRSFQFKLQDGGLVEDTVSAGAGQTAGTFYIPIDEDSESEAPQVTYILAGGTGSADNGRFVLDGADMKIEGTPLVYGDHYIRVRATDDEDNIVEKTFNFRVSVGPPEMETPPLLIPNCIDSATSGENKLTVEWPQRNTATCYRVYISKTSGVYDDNAMLFGTYNEPTRTTEIDTFPGEENKLPNGTRYWVWVRAASDRGEAQPGAVATVKTFDTIDPWWYDGVAYFTFANADGYIVTSTTVRYNSSTGGLQGFTTDILHHEVFDPDDVARYIPTRGKHGENIAGLPAGVFIVKLQDGEFSNNGHRYTSVYYWGRGFGGSNGKSYIINPWRTSGVAYPEKATYAEAIETFTVQEFRNWAWTGIDEPYSRVMQ